MDFFVYAGRRAVVTGGLGFIGSNLAIRLVQLGADVTIVDSSVPGCGANPFNIRGIRDQVRLVPLDIGRCAEFESEIRACDVIFNLAGEISHTRSMSVPERDLQLNTIAQLRFLEVCRRARPGVRVVFASTRQVYGCPQYLPVDERHPTQATDFNGIHKLAAAQYHLMMTRRGELDAAVLRLTNVYGPRMALNLPWQGFLGVFTRMALRSEEMTVFGDGTQLRDPVYSEDVVDAMLRAGACPVLPSRVYNVGGPEPLTLRAIAETFARQGCCGVRCVPYPAALKEIDIGSYYTDTSRIGEDLGWRPRTRFADGIQRTLAYYRQHASHYLVPANAGAAAVSERELEPALLP